MQNYQEKIRFLLKELSKKIYCDSAIVHIYYPYLDEFDIPIAIGNIKYPLLKPIDKSVLLWRVIKQNENEFFTSNFDGDYYFHDSKFIKREEIFSSGFIKLFRKDLPVGILFINYKNTHEFSEDQISRIRNYSDQIEELISNNIPFWPLLEDLLGGMCVDTIGIQIIDNSNKEKLYALEVNNDSTYFHRNIDYSEIYKICKNKSFVNRDFILLEKLPKSIKSSFKELHHGIFHVYRINESVYIFLYFGFNSSNKVFSKQKLDENKKTLDKFPQMGKFIIESMNNLRSRSKLDNLIQTTNSLLNRYDNIGKIIHYYLFYSMSLTGANAGRFIIINRYGDYYAESIENSEKKINTIDQQIVEKIIPLPWNDVESKFIFNKQIDKSTAILKNNCRAKAIIPINDGRKLIGILELEYEKKKEFDHEFQELTKLISDYFQILIIRTLQTDRISLINKTISEINGPDIKLETIYEKILHVIVDLTFADIGSIAVVDENKNVIRDISEYRYEDKNIKPVERSLDQASICAWVYKNKKYALIKNFQKQPEWKIQEHRINKKTLSQLTIPIFNIKNLDQVDGIINLESEYENGFDERDVLNGQELAKSASIAKANIERIHLLEEQNSRLNALYHAAEVISRNQFDIEPILKTLLNESIKATRVDIGFIKVFNNNQLVVEYSIPDYLKSKYLNKSWTNQTIENTIEGYCIKEKRAVHCNQINENDLDLTSEIENKKAILSAPLLLKNQIKGILTIVSEGKDFSNDDDALVDALIRLSMSGYENVTIIKDQQEMNRRELISFLEPFNKLSYESERIFNSRIKETLDKADILNMLEEIKANNIKYSKILEKEILNNKFRSYFEQKEELNVNIFSALNLAIRTNEKEANRIGLKFKRKLSKIKDINCRIDRNLLIAILSNLIINAIKYSKKDAQYIYIEGKDLGGEVIISILNEYEIPLINEYSMDFNEHDKNVKIFDDLISQNKRAISAYCGDLWYGQDEKKKMFIINLKIQKVKDDGK